MRKSKRRNRGQKYQELISNGFLSTVGRRKTDDGGTSATEADVSRKKRAGDVEKTSKGRSVDPMAE